MIIYIKYIQSVGLNDELKKKNEHNILSYQMISQVTFIFCTPQLV